MNSLNSILAEGNVTRDAESKTTVNGTVVCIFSIASNRSWKKGEEWEQEVSFFDIEVWGKLAEYCARECKKGRGVRIVGRLKQDRWVDTDGKARSKIKIVAEHIELKPKMKASDNQQNQQDQQPIDTGAPPDDIPF